MLNYLKKKRANIICLQDTHLTKQDQKLIRYEWDNECVLHGVKTNERAILILFDSQFEYKINSIKGDDQGNLLNIDMQISDMRVKLINLYAPNQDTPCFFDYIGEMIDSSEQDYTIVCGDFNLVLDPKKDSYNYSNVNNPQARKKVLQLIKENNLIDTFRHTNEDVLRYTWRKKRPLLKQARLDYIIVSDTLCDLIEKCDIIPGYRSDHSIVQMNLLINKFIQGKELWKFNTKLLKEKHYLDLINKCIDDEKLKYALPVYNYEEIKNIPNDHLQFRIHDGLFLEMLYQRIRGESIKFASKLKKTQISKEQNLVRDINELER